MILLERKTNFAAICKRVISYNLPESNTVIIFGTVIKKDSFQSSNVLVIQVQIAVLHEF